MDVCILYCDIILYHFQVYGCEPGQPIQRGPEHLFKTFKVILCNIVLKKQRNPFPLHKITDLI